MRDLLLFPFFAWRASHNRAVTKRRAPSPEDAAADKEGIDGT